MTKKFMMLFLVAALAILCAKTYTVSFDKAVTVSGTELKAGSYRLSVAGDKVTFTSGKESIEKPVKVEQTDSKFWNTAVRMSNADGKALVQEIQLGGTNTKLVFSN